MKRCAKAVIVAGLILLALIYVARLVPSEFVYNIRPPPPIEQQPPLG